jgi:hypothetical protein
MIQMESQWMRVTLTWLRKMREDPLRSKIAGDVEIYLMEHVGLSIDTFVGFKSADVAKSLGIKPHYVMQVLKIMISLNMVKKDNQKPIYFVNPRLLWNGKDSEKHGFAVLSWESGDMWFDFVKYRHSQTPKNLLKSSTEGQNHLKYPENPEDPQNPQIAREILEDFYDY